LSAELLSHPFIFIGTTLDESLLWQHIQLRSTRGGSGLGEFRRKSFLVIPHLDKAREVALSQYNVEWIPMDAETFAAEVLSKLGDTIAKGLNVISKRNATITDNELIVPEVSTLIGGALIKTEFLLGSEPIWSDIQSGRAITRNSDDDLWNKVSELRKGKGARGIVLVTGTAGSGKSTALMRIALHLSSDGTRVGWIDRDSEVSLRGIRRAFQKGSAPDVIVIDDADLLGSDLGSTLREICLYPPYPLFVLGIRSGSVDRILNPAQLGQTPSHEYTMPLLTDEDIAGLIDALTNDNKLGKLRGLTRIEQENALRDKTGRELLVAMIEATSGLRFEEKAVKEYEELDEDKKRIYAIVATATALQFSLSKKDILIAVGRQDNAVLNALDQLVRRNIILKPGDTESSYRARHRVLGEIVERKLQSAGQLYDVIRGLIIVVATQVTPEMPRTAKPKRLLIRLINNAFLHRMLGREQASNLYGELESHLKNESHYWLQRGILEVEAGNLRLAKNWLDQAKGISPDDDFIETEYALWEFRTAIENPADLKSHELVVDACSALEHQIALNGKRFHHAYHVLGSQCLAWVRHGLEQFEEQRDFLEYGIEKVKEGFQNHPTNNKLKTLLKEMEDEKLNLVLRR
jgi:tetratricopeptide (TPR) repeat protein